MRSSIIQLANAAVGCLIAIIISPIQATPLPNQDTAPYLTTSSLGIVEPTCIESERTRPILSKKHCIRALADFISKYKAKEYIFSRDTKKLGRPGYAILPLYFPNYECKVILDAAQGFEQRVTTMDLVVGAATTIDHCVGNRPRVVNGGIVFVESQTKGYFVDVIVSDGGPHSVGANSTASFEELKQIAAAHETVKPVQIG